ncbi:MAG: Na/Pi cotransporter family protein [Mogibacterium sp.]|nr:Na/Pi cotransporter family protein [Mogibacterium sp.]
MEVFYRIVSLLGGLALFLYGMRIMGDGLKSSSGGAMKAALEKVTNTPVMAFLLGVLVTCMIQSSTATIVLTVGLVGAGFLTFRQSIGIVLGANVGTAITAQIIRLMDVQAGSESILYFFKSDNLAPLALTIGIILIMFVKTRAASSAGTICMGFGILFVGLMNMSAAVSEMGDSLTKLLVSFEGSYILGFLSGVLVTGIIQSSSAVVGILQSLASTVGVRFCGVFAIIIGVNIGDCITTYLVCRLGAKSEQIRTCVVHVVYNIFAAILLVLGLTILRQTGILNDNIWYASLNAGGVANVHGLFRLIPAVLLLPFTEVFAKIAERIVPDSPEVLEDAVYEENIRKLDPRLITNPRMALIESEQLLTSMAEVAIHNYNAAAQQLFSYEDARDKRIRQREDLLDRMTDAADQYIVSISPYITLDTDRRNQSFQLKALVCFERIGDLAINMIDAIMNMHSEKKSFSNMARKEIRVAMSAVGDILDLATDAYSTGDVDKAKSVEPLEETIDEIIEDLRGRHVYRMTHGLCDVFNGIQYQNILLNLERISDQCSDLAVYLLGRTDPTILGNEHQYVHDLHHSGKPGYLAEFEQNRAKYFAELNKIHPLEG